MPELDKLHQEDSVIGSLGEHLEELRKRLGIILVSFVIILLASFSSVDKVLVFLEAVAPYGSKFFQLKPGELFMASLRVCIFMASFLTLPILCYHIEAFLKPALKSAESKILAPILLASPILAFTGLAFAYYFLLPPLLEFLFGFAKAIVEPYYGLEHYINLVLSIMIITALSFQLPVLIIAFAYFSIINSGQLLQAWRYVILGSFVVSALITPTPDPITMSILAAALLILYFVTYLVVRAMGK